MAAGAAYGSSIVTVQFLGVVPGTPGDGTGNYVTPYEISINGGTAISVTCYDKADSVSIGDTWQANLLSISEAASTGFFSSLGLATATADYTEVAWLSGQGYSDPDHEVALQEAIWSVFGIVPPAAFQNANQVTYYNAYLTAAGVAASTNYAAYDLSGFQFLEQVGGVVGSTDPATEQAFVFGVINPNTTNTFGTPEPGTSFMLAGGLFCLLASLGFKRLSAKRG